MTHRGDLLHRVVDLAPDEAAHASHAVGDAGNVVGMVLDFPPIACRRSAQRGIARSRVRSVERLAHGRGVRAGTQTSRMWACVSRWRTRNS